MNSIADILSDHGLEHTQPTSHTPFVEDTQYQQPLNSNTNTDVTPSTQPLDLERVKTMLFSLKDQVEALLRLVNGEQIALHARVHPDTTLLASGEKILEGVFNGHQMIGPDGKEYPVPPNYASKSKLVEGDLMKLTITRSGAFIYKQIGPIKRKRVVGELVADDTSGQWKVHVSGKPYKILTASVTFYRGKGGDDVAILIPEDGDSDWGAVENIIHKT